MFPNGFHQFFRFKTTLPLIIFRDEAGDQSKTSFALHFAGTFVRKQDFLTM
jgi:hypothetical protein